MKPYDPTELKLKYLEGLYKNTLVLEYNRLMLFKGVELNFCDDYYFMLIEERTNETIYFSAVGRLIFLKKSLPQEDYDYLKLVWNNNNREQAI